MKSENIRLSIDVPSVLHKVIKFHIAENHLNIKNYVLNLIKEDLSEDLEDYILGHMALQAEKEGYLGVKESKKFLKKNTKEKKINHKKTAKNAKPKRK